MKGWASGCSDIPRLTDLRLLLSDGLQVFFMRQAEAAQGTPNRHTFDIDLMRIGSFQHPIIQREVGLSCHPHRDPVPQTGQFSIPAAVTLSARLKPTCLAFQDHHIVHELH